MLFRLKHHSVILFVFVEANQNQAQNAASVRRTNGAKIKQKVRNESVKTNNVEIKVSKLENKMSEVKQTWRIFGCLFRNDIILKNKYFLLQYLT